MVESPVAQKMMSVCASPKLVPAWNLDVELQKELDAISIRSHFSSSSSSAGDDEYSNKGDDSEALSVEATNAKLDMLLDGWRAKEKRLQEYEQSLKKIRLWQGDLVTHEELRGKALEDNLESSSGSHVNSVIPGQARPAIGLLAVGTSKPRNEDTVGSHDADYQRDLKQSVDSIMEFKPHVRGVPGFITHLRETPRESPRKVLIHGANSCDQGPTAKEVDLKSMKTFQETRGDKETVSSGSCSSENGSEVDPLLMLRARRTKLLEEFRATEFERARKLDQRRKVESEESQRKIALASERRQELEEELQKEQKNKFAALEMEQKLKIRLFEELQRAEENNLVSEKKDMEMTYRVLTDLSDTYKHLEEELDIRRLDEDETLTVTLSQVIRAQENDNTFRSSDSATAGAAAESHMWKCCTQIQALVRGYLCRKRYKDVRSRESESEAPTQMEYACFEDLVSGVQDSCLCKKRGDMLPPAESPEGICSNWQLIEDVSERLTNLAETGSMQEIYSCSEVARSIGLDEQASSVEDRLHQRQENMQNWLTQVVNGWDTGRRNLQKQFEEANKLRLAPMYAVAEAVVFAREKYISENLEMAIIRASRWDFYDWMCKAKVMGMDEVISKSYRGFHRRFKLVKDSLEKETKLGTRDQYSLPFQEATSLSLPSDTRRAIKVILKRVLQFVRRAIVLGGTKSNKHNPRAQDWKTVETEGAQIGLDMRTMEYLKQSICRSRGLECVKRVWITNYRINSTGMPFELINKKHGSVAGWDNTLVYPLTDTESELPVVLDDTRRCSDPVLDSSNDTLPSVDAKLRQGRNLWVMPHNWSEMLRCQSLWQQHMIRERTVGLFSRSGSQEARNFRSENNKTINACEKMRESPTLPFITGNFQESFTLEELRERQNDTLDNERDHTPEEEHEHDDAEGHEPVAAGHEYKEDRHATELIVEPVTTTASKCRLTREMLQQKFSLGRKELRWVTKLDLINAGLTSLGTKGIFRWCPRLRCLSVDKNTLTNFKQVFEGGEEYLEELSAIDNSLEDLTGLEALQRLTVLHLDGNLLSQLTAHRTRTVKEDLAPKSSNARQDHSGLPPGISEVSWPRLQVLTLSCNQLTNVSQLGSLCPNLEILDLGSNQLVTLGKGEKNALAGLQHLRVLDVGQNKLKSTSLWEGLKHCPELVSLVASRNNLTELPNHSGSVLLREIWLNGNSIKQLGCKVWLPSLQRLYLQDNLITSLEPLWGCPGLEVLDLSFNCISEYSQLQHLSGFPNLRSLQLNDNPISEQEDHADYVLQAVPWLAELDNEAVSKASRDKAIATLLNNMMEVAGVAFVKEKLVRGDSLLRGFTNPRSAHKISFNKREHSENRNGQFLNRSVWEVNDVMNGEADEASLWAVLLEAKQLALSSAVFQNLLKMNAELIKLGSARVLSEAEFEARSIMTAYQQMTHGLRGKLHAATKERCSRVSKETDISAQHTHQRWALSDGQAHLGPQSQSSGVSLNSDKCGASHLEWCLEEHASFDPRAYTEIYIENTEYRLEADAKIRRVIKLQALARARMARLRVKLLMKDRKEKQEVEMHRNISRVQALWRSWKIRKQNLLEHLKAEETERKLQNASAIVIQALWRGYITRLKFQQALKRAKYTDDDDFDYVPIDETDFLAGELALASYQPGDMYVFAVGSTRASDTPPAGDRLVQETKPELHAPKQEGQQAVTITSESCRAPSSGRIVKPKIDQLTNSISHTFPPSSTNAPTQRETERVTNSVAHISQASRTSNIEKSVTEKATNFCPQTSLPSDTNNIHKTIVGAVTHSAEKTCLDSIPPITEATITKDITCTKDSFPPGTVVRDHELVKEAKTLDHPVKLDRQCLDELLKSMGFTSPFPNSKAQEIADSGGDTTTEGRLDRLISSSIDSEFQFGTNERTHSQAEEPKKKAISDDKKAAMEEIAKDWGFKNEKTAEAYFKARERTMKQAKSAAHQQHLRDPETRFKRFKAKLGGPLPAGAPPLRLSEAKAPSSFTTEDQLYDCKNHLRERVYEGGFQSSATIPPSNRKAPVLEKPKEQKPLFSVTDVPIETKVAEMKKDTRQKDPRRTSTIIAHGELSPWHIPKLNLNSSLEAFLIRDGQDSRR